ncbi:MAG: crossover junction endodeoxyribonuclease RuvC [Proteobacteria bacterium]|nr:crossover junction endodeoxyribonuclease RuvC [Pseudomonadota bacterium]
MRVLGLDPGLRRTGWGVVDAAGGRLRHVADGVIATNESRSTAERLVLIHEGLAAVIASFRPDAAAVEETFVNKNPTTTLILGQARGVVLLAPALAGVAVFEYGANQIKKSVVGVGHATKEQVTMMVRTLLPAADIASPDAADALAAAICHAHHMETARRWGEMGRHGRVRPGLGP